MKAHRPSQESSAKLHKSTNSRVGELWPAGTSAHTTSAAPFPTHAAPSLREENQRTDQWVTTSSRTTRSAVIKLSRQQTELTGGWAAPCDRIRLQREPGLNASLVLYMMMLLEEHEAVLEVRAGKKLQLLPNPSASLSGEVGSRRQSQLIQENQVKHVPATDFNHPALCGKSLCSYGEKCSVAPVHFLQFPSVSCRCQ